MKWEEDMKLDLKEVGWQVGRALSGSCPRRSLLLAVLNVESCYQF
jgi:hypothetical protein